MSFCLCGLHPASAWGVTCGKEEGKPESRPNRRQTRLDTQRLGKWQTLVLCGFLGDLQQLCSLRPEPPTQADLTLAVMLACPSRNIRAALLPCSESTTCLFRTRPLDAADTLVFNEVFWVSMSYPALHQKTLRVDVCTTDRCHLEECLVRALSVCPAFCPS